jgi:hypothetical protein
MNKDAFYFPHFCNARHDRKIKRLRKELGLEGYGIYFMLLETLREQLDFKYPMDDIDLLAEEFGTSEQKVKVTICNYQLFDIDEHNSFFSVKLIEYLEPYFKMKLQRQKSAKARWDKVNKEKELSGNNDATVLQPYCESNATVLQPYCESNASAMQSKQSKENESKESKENETNKYFEKFWNLYDKNISKDKCLIIFNKLNENEIQKIFQTLPDYLASTPDKLYRKNPESYLNNKTWNDEIILPDEIDTSIIPEKIRNEFIAYMDFRKDIKDPIISQKTVLALIDKLREMTEGNTNLAKSIINNAIACQHKSFYPIKKEEPSPNYISFDKVVKERLNEIGK